MKRLRNFAGAFRIYHPLYLVFVNAILTARPVNTLAMMYFCNFIQDGFVAKNAAAFDAIIIIIN